MPETLFSSPPSPFPDGIEEQEPEGDRPPPRSTRFRPGQSGNPRGRPKGAQGVREFVARALGERVEAKENGRRRRISKLEAMVKQLINRAAGGDPRATQFVFALLRADKDDEPPYAFDKEADALVMAELVRRTRDSRNDDERPAGAEAGAAVGGTRRG